MSGDGELISDIAAGALAARAAEPDHGESSNDGHTHEAACLNCGTMLVGSHCHACGQVAHVHRTITAFFHDLLHGVFHFEGKIWRTLPMLAWKPGQLTREYIEGRRASYVSPIALFLFCVFLMFAVVKNLSLDLGANADVEVNGKHIIGLEENEAELTKLRQKRVELVAAGKSTDAIDGEIEGRESGIASIRKLNDPVGVGQVIAESEQGSPVQPAIHSDIQMLDQAFKKAAKNPQLALYKLRSNAYKFAWALIPLSVPFVWLLFVRRRRVPLYDHTVFVTYSLCFMMLLVSALSILNMIGVAAFAVGMNVIPPLHIYRQVRQAYALTRWQAIWRTAALCLYALFSLIVFLMLMVVVGD